jgi:hypothetical protein
MSLINSNREVLNLLARTRVFFLGFESNIASLYSEGWSIDMQYDCLCARHLAFLKNKDTNLCGFINDFNFQQGYTQPLFISRVFPVDNINIAVHGKLEPYFSLSMRESISEYVEKSNIRLSDLLDFDKPKELIVDTEEVQSLFNRIIELQRPAQQEIREKKKTIKQTQAKIITLADYMEA